MITINVDENRLAALLEFAEEQNFERLAGDEENQVEIEEAIAEIRKAVTATRSHVECQNPDCLFHPTLD